MRRFGSRPEAWLTIIALVQYHRPEMSAITDLFAGVPVSDLDASIDWYTRFVGRPPDWRAGDEILWEIEEHGERDCVRRAARRR
jgi:hypothetical protein